MAKRKLVGKHKGPFVAHDFALIGDPHATIYRQRGGSSDDFFMQVATPEGADDLVAIINAAVALGDRTDLLGGEPAAARQKVAYAVAKALGGCIDFEAFRHREMADRHRKMAARESLNDVAAAHERYADEHDRKAEWRA